MLSWPVRPHHKAKPKNKFRTFLGDACSPAPSSPVIQRGRWRKCASVLGNLPDCLSFFLLSQGCKWGVGSQGSRSENRTLWGLQKVRLALWFGNSGYVTVLCVPTTKENRQTSDRGRVQGVWDSLSHGGTLTSGGRLGRGFTGYGYGQEGRCEWLN